MCIDTPQQLKEKYGDGYIISMILTEKVVKEQVNELMA